MPAKPPANVANACPFPTASRSRDVPTAGGHRLWRRSLRTLIATLLAAGTASSAAAQGSGGNFPDPRSGETVAAWLAAVGGDATPESPVWPLHAAYLDRATLLRDGEIEAWLGRSMGGGFLVAGGDLEASAQRSAERSASQRRLVDRLGLLESAFWNEAAAALRLDAAALATLQARGVRERALDLRIRQRLLGSEPPADLLEVLARLGAGPDEAAAIREVLADHDQRLTDAVGDAMEEELDRPARLAAAIAARAAIEASRREAAIAEADAAAREGEAPPAIALEAAFDGDDPVLRSFASDRGVRGIVEQQLDSLERLRTIVGEERLDGLLVSLRLVPGDGIANLLRRRVDPRIRSGEIGSEAAAEIAAIRADHFRERLRIGLAYARGLAATDGAMEFDVAGDLPEVSGAARRMEPLRRELLEELPDRTRGRLASLVDLCEEGRGIEARSAGTDPGDASIAIERGEETASATITFSAVAIVATGIGGEETAIEAEIATPLAITFSGEAGLMMLGDLPSAAPPLAALDASRLAAMFAEAGGDPGMAPVAEQLRRDAAESFDAILSELAERLAAAATRRDPGDPAGIEAILARADGVPSAAIDAALARGIEADAQMFESLEDLLGSDSATTLARWREARAIELVSIAAGLRGGSGEFSFSPWRGRHASLDLLGLILETVPEVLADPAIAASAMERLREIRRAVEGHWSEQQRLRPALAAARRASFVIPPAAGDGAKAALDGQQTLARLELQRDDADRRIHRAIRTAIEEFQRSLSPEAARTFHAAVRREAWPDAVPSMPALAAMNEAMRIVQADEAAATALAEIERRYLAESDRLFARLDAFEAGDAAGDAGEFGDFSPRRVQRWESAAGRLRFLHRELDHATVLELRRLVGPDRAGRIEWPSREASGRPTITFFGT